MHSRHVFELNGKDLLLDKQQVAGEVMVEVSHAVSKRPLSRTYR